MTLPSTIPSNSMPFELTQVSEFVFCVQELDPWSYHPLMYIIVGEEKVLLIDTGCDYGNYYFFVKSTHLLGDRRIVVVNTHNHAQQTGGNWRFSTTGKCGLAHKVDALCASARHKYYTKLLNSTQHWTVKTYKVTRWLADGERILLGPEENPRNVVDVLWSPGHTPDSLVLHYPLDGRLFIGDLFYRFADIDLTYEFTDLRDYESSLRMLLEHAGRMPPGTRYSSAKSERDGVCLPTLRQFQRFFFAVTAGVHPGRLLRMHEADGWCFETRDRAMRVLLSQELVQHLEHARHLTLKADQKRLSSRMVDLNK